MAKTEIVCLRISGASIPYYVGKLLALASIKLYQSGEKQLKLKGDGYEGVLTCSFKRLALSELNGIGFFSKIEYNLPREWGGGSRQSEVVFFTEDSLLNIDLSKQTSFSIIDPTLN